MRYYGGMPHAEWGQPPGGYYEGYFWVAICGARDPMPTLGHYAAYFGARREPAT